MRDYEESAPRPGGAQARGSKQKKVLIISRAFPPESGSAVYRPLKFTKFLPSYGWKPYVVTPKKNVSPLDYSLTKDIPKGVSVSEVFSLDAANLKAILWKRYNHGDIGKLGYSFLKALLKVYSIIYYRVVIVDWHDGWVPFGFIKAKQVASKENIDLIYVDMEPPSSSVIGLLLKRVTGKPLVIDYHDPWTTSVYKRQDRECGKGDRCIW